MTEILKKFNCPFQSNTGQNICNDIKEVKYKEGWLGHTGYIDRVRPNDSVFNEVSIVKFSDQYNRSAIAFKYKIFCPNEKDSNEYAVTAFQRYTDDNLWVYGGHFAHHFATQIGQVSIDELEGLLEKKQKDFLNFYSFDDIKSCVMKIDIMTGESSHIDSQEL